MSIEGTTGGGWCIHGVPYGPNWSCGQCAGAIANRTSFTTEQPPRDEELHRKLLRIIDLLEKIARVQR